MENTAISNNDAKTELSGFQNYSPSNIVILQKPSKRSEGIYDILPDITICGNTAADCIISFSFAFCCKIAIFVQCILLLVKNLQLYFFYQKINVKKMAIQTWHNTLKIK